MTREAPMEELIERLEKQAEEIVRRHADVVCNESVICNYSALANDIMAAIKGAQDRSELMALVSEQAEDVGLWYQAETAAEAYVQQALRRLHAAIEGKSPDECALAALRARFP